MSHPKWTYEVAETLKDALAEIERLRSMHQDMCRVAGNLGDENERLRAALQRIKDSDGRFDTMYEIAQRALGDEQTSD